MVIRSIAAGAVAVLVVGCGAAPVPPSGNNAALQIEAERAPRFPEAALVKAREGIRAEPKMVDFLLDPDRAVELTVAVWDDGSNRSGYAGYYCLRLREWGAYDDNMDVRIVDAAKLVEADGDFRSISLGGIHCSDESYFR